MLNEGRPDATAVPSVNRTVTRAFPQALDDACIEGTPAAVKQGEMAAPASPSSPSRRSSGEARMVKGDLAEYYSTTNGGWVPAVVVRFNEDNNTYVLDIQPVAAVHKVRARKVRQSLPPQDASREVSVTLQPGKIGTSGIKDGIVKRVEKGSQAERVGVMEGWRFYKLEGAEYSVRMLDELVTGNEDYTVTFLTHQDSASSSTAPPVVPQTPLLQSSPQAGNVKATLRFAAEDEEEPDESLDGLAKQLVQDRREAIMQGEGAAVKRPSHDASEPSLAAEVCKVDSKHARATREWNSLQDQQGQPGANQQGMASKTSKTRGSPPGPPPGPPPPPNRAPGFATKQHAANEKLQASDDHALDRTSKQPLANISGDRRVHERSMLDGARPVKPGAAAAPPPPPNEASPQAPLPPLTQPSPLDPQEQGGNTISGHYRGGDVPRGEWHELQERLQSFMESEASVFSRAANTMEECERRQEQLAEQQLELECNVAQLTARATPIKQEPQVAHDLDKPLSPLSPALRFNHNILQLSIPFGSLDSYDMGQRFDAFTRAECVLAKGKIEECELRSQEYIEHLRERAAADEQRCELAEQRLEDRWRAFATAECEAVRSACFRTEQRADLATLGVRPCSSCDGHGCSLCSAIVATPPTSMTGKSATEGADPSPSKANPFIEDLYRSVDVGREVAVTLQPGRIGITGIKDGIVKRVEKGSQAERVGVTVGWRFHKLEGAAYSVPRLDELIAGSKGYTITFMTKQDFDRERPAQPPASNRQKPPRIPESAAAVPEDAASALRDAGAAIEVPCEMSPNPLSDSSGKHKASGQHALVPQGTDPAVNALTAAAEQLQFATEQLQLVVTNGQKVNASRGDIEDAKIELDHGNVACLDPPPTSIPGVIECADAGKEALVTQVPPTSDTHALGMDGSHGLKMDLSPARSQSFDSRMMTGLVGVLLLLVVVLVVILVVRSP